MSSYNSCYWPGVGQTAPEASLFITHFQRYVPMHFMVNYMLVYVAAIKLYLFLMQSWAWAGRCLRAVSVADSYEQLSTPGLGCCTYRVCVMT